MILGARQFLALSCRSLFGWACVFVLGFGTGLAIRPPALALVESPPVLPVAPAEATPALRTAHPAEVLRVLDGDTFEARVHLWPGLDVTTRVRLRGIDAPELKARCREERDKAEAARNALRAMLARGDVGVMRVTLDKYGGRVLADASAHDVPDIATSLLDAGYVRRYYPGSRRDGWCS